MLLSIIMSHDIEKLVDESFAVSVNRLAGASRVDSAESLRKAYTYYFN